MKTPVNLRFFTIAVLVAISHLAIGLMVWLGNVEPALHTTQMDLISKIFNYNPMTVGLVFAISAIMAAIPFIETYPRRRGLLLVIPQQVILLIQAVSILLALWNGHYPDGYVPKSGSNFIFVDQLMLLTLIVWHTLEYYLTMFVFINERENK